MSLPRVVAAAALGLALTAAIGIAASREVGYDFAAYVAAADRLLAGHRLYPAAGEGALYLGAGEFLYPPPVAVLFIPFALLPFAISRVLWTALLVAVSAAVVWIHVRRLAPVPRLWAIAASVLFLPLIAEVTLGNVNLLSLGLCALAWERRRHAAQAGAALATAVGLKLLPALVPVFFLVAGSRRAVGWGAAFAVAVVLLTLPWLGGAWPEYLALLAEVAGAPATSALTLLPAALQSTVGRAALAGVAVILTLASAVAARADARRADRAFAISLAAAPLAAPGLWYPYLVFALPLLLRAAADAVSPQSRADLARAVTAGVSWSAMQIPKRADGSDVAFAGLLALLVSELTRLRRGP